MFIVEGNIGVGKSSFLKLINQYNPNIEISPEPKENWTKESYGQSLLANFYKDISRWAYTLETLTMIYRTKAHLKEQIKQNQYRLVERSIYSGHYCFAKNDFHNGYLSDLEWQIYNEWATFLITNKCFAPKGFIYLQTSPQICFERIQKRNRISEKNITLDYIKQIHNQHEQFLIEKKDIFENIKNVPVLVLDASENFAQNPQKIIYFSNQLDAFFNKSIAKPTPNTKIEKESFSSQ
jgi:deoxyguanosine kinase